MRNLKIQSLLLMVGADTSASTVSMVDSLIDFIPTNYLKNFTEYVLKNYDKHRKPIVNITTASQEYKKRLQIAMIRKGEFKIKTVEETKDFILEFFKGQEICNCVTGLYQPFVVIELNEKEEFVNKFSFKKLDSLEVSEFIHWCFLNQERIGDVKLIPSETVKALMLENQKRIDALELELRGGVHQESQDIANSVKSLLHISRVTA